MTDVAFDMEDIMGKSYMSIAERMEHEDEALKALRGKRLSFGVNFLDKATRGILQDDLVLLGAGSGVGKTAFATNLALTNMLMNRKVFFIALEASENEIERRLSYQLYSKHYFLDPNREVGPLALNFTDFVLGVFDHQLSKYKPMVDTQLSQYNNLNTFYKDKSFGPAEFADLFTEAVAYGADLVICDHVHYFDFTSGGNDNENLKQVIMLARDLTQISKVPLLLIAHLRKVDKSHPEIIPGIHEFHGSSDLTKVATKVLTIGSGGPVLTDEGKFYTYLGFPKNRMDGSITRYAAKLKYDIKTNTYDPKFVVGRLESNNTEFHPLAQENYPYWMSREPINA